MGQEFPIAGKLVADGYNTPLADSRDIYDDVNNQALNETIAEIKSAASGQVQSDWEQSNTQAKDFIKNKPTIPDISGKADKSEMSITPGSGANADKANIQLKNGTSVTVLTQHQDISGKENKINDLATIRSGAAAGATAQQPATTLAGYGITDAYRKNETYTRQEVNNLVSTPTQEFISIVATDQTVDAATLIAAEVAAGDQERDDVIYRIGNWDGAQYDTTVYSEYAWNGTLYVLLCVKSGTVDIADSAITESKIADGAVTLNKMAHTEYLQVIYSDNLINTNDPDIIVGKWINLEGVTSANADYYISGYIPVTPGSTYYAGYNGTAHYSAMRSYEFYNADKQLIVGSYVNNDNGQTSFTAPQNAAFVRLSVALTVNNAQLNKDSLKAYDVWNEKVYVKGSRIESGSVSFDKLTNGESVEALLPLADMLVSVFGDNLINPNAVGVIQDRYINLEGSTQHSESYFITEYISVTPGSVYYAGNNGVEEPNVMRTYEFYDETKTVIQNSFVSNSGVSQTSSFTAPVGSAYVRLSVAKMNTKPQLNEGQLKPYSEWTEPTTKFNGAKLCEKSVKLESLEDGEQLEKAISSADIVKYVQSKNLLNPNDEDVCDGKVLLVGPSLQDNINYYVSGYIPVKPGKTYYAGNNGTLNYTVIRTYAFYDANKTYITDSFLDNTSSIKATSVIAPQNAAYLRISVLKSNEYAHINEESLKPYSEWEEPYMAIDGQSIEKGTIDLDRLCADAKSNIGKQTFRNFRSSEQIAPQQYLTLPTIHIQKNNLLCCDVTGTISKIAVGVGYLDNETYQNRNYAALWVEIDNTNIKQYRSYNSAPVLINTVQHGITLTNQTKVIMSFGVDSGKVILYNDLGDVFESTLQSAGVGIPFVYNDGSTNLTCTLTDFPRDLNKKIWLFGDSYVSFVSDTKWSYYFNEYGYTDWLCNSQPGLSPSTAVSDLTNLLTLGYSPSLLVWMIGMNGDTNESQEGGQYVISDYQKRYIDDVVNICNEKGIELVLTIIPTVPGRQKTGFGSYIKSLGVRYIDWAKAVGTNPSGQWNNGLLSSDLVHPTALGAKVLASQVFADCPELTLVD